MAAALLLSATSSHVCSGKYAASLPPRDSTVVATRSRLVLGGKPRRKRCLPRRVPHASEDEVVQGSEPTERVRDRDFVYLMKQYQREVWRCHMSTRWRQSAIRWLQALPMHCDGPHLAEA